MEVVGGIWGLTDGHCIYTINTMLDLSEPYEFEWDEGNIKKNLIKHGIDCRESEEVFLDQAVALVEDTVHSFHEQRYLIIGKTLKNKLLGIIFTKRKNKIRIISARIASKLERRLYE